MYYRHDPTRFLDVERALNLYEQLCLLPDGLYGDAAASLALEISQNPDTPENMRSKFLGGR